MVVVLAPKPYYSWQQCAYARRDRARFESVVLVSVGLCAFGWLSNAGTGHSGGVVE
jgi:hypothetical protein